MIELAWFLVGFVLGAVAAGTLALWIIDRELR
jgi:hypothetical protein